MENENNTEKLLNDYKPLVKAIAKDYYLTGGDLEDLIQEGMIGLYKATVDYKAEKGASFATFARLCIVRQIQTAIKAASRKKHMPLNDFVNLDFISQEEEIPAATQSPEELALAEESCEDLYTIIDRALSEMEHKVFSMHMDGLMHIGIARYLNISEKAVDNAMQRIRKKLGKALGRQSSL